MLASILLVKLLHADAQPLTATANPGAQTPPRERGGLAAAFARQNAAQAVGQAQPLQAQRGGLAAAFARQNAAQAGVQQQAPLQAPSLAGWDPRNFGLHEALLKSVATKKSQSRAFKALENHNLQTENKSFNGKHHCTNDQVHRIYESLVAKHVVDHPEMKQELRPVLRSVFDGMKKRPHGDSNWYETAAKSWHENTDPLHHLGVTQVHALKDKKIELDRGLKTDVGLDFLLFNAKGYDYKGVPPEVLKVRDAIYAQKIGPMRGNRVDFKQDGENRKSNQMGFVTATVPQLEKKGASPWVKWGDHICRIDKQVPTTYVLSGQKKEIPLVCGISGSSTLVLWSALGSGAKLKESEWRHLMLSTWATLAADGGHTLQEVLSAARINADYLKENPHLIQKAGLNPASVRAFLKATKGLSADGMDKNAHNFGAYHDAFFSKIKSPGLKEARKRAQKETLEYLQNSQACKN